jgi:uncharacterized alkaline shock family protein YloU
VNGSNLPPATAGLIAEAIAAAVSKVAGVAQLSGGKFGQIATYAPGRKVSGVRVTVDHIEVHVVAEWVPSLPRLADDVRAAVAPLAEARSVNVFVDDITQVEIEPPGSSPAEPLGGHLAVGGNGWSRLAWAKTEI